MQSPHYKNWKRALTEYYKNQLLSHNITSATKAMLTCGFSQFELETIAISLEKDKDIIGLLTSVQSCTKPVV